MQDIEIQFHGGSVTQKEADIFFVEDFSRAERVELQDLFCQAYALVSAKLAKYMSVDGQPGIDFLQQVQFFHPNKLIMFPQSETCIMSHLSSLTGLAGVPESEVKKYMFVCGPTAVKNSVSSVNVDQFWQSVCDELPCLAACAKRYIYATTSSADAERSFSIYNLILSDRRRRLSIDSLRALAFLCYNRFVGANFFS